MARYHDPGSSDVLLKLVLAAGFLVAMWVKNRFKAATRDKSSRPNRPTVVVTRRLGEGTDAAEEVRRVQEEIRRKIEARMGPASGMPRPAETAPPPTATPTPPALPARRVIELEQRVALAERRRAAAEQARAREEEARLLQMAKADAADSTSAYGSIGLGRTTPSVSVEWLQELRDPGSLRRVVVLREILGPPAGLR